MTREEQWLQKLSDLRDFLDGLRGAREKGHRAALEYLASERRKHFEQRLMTKPGEASRTVVINVSQETPEGLAELLEMINGKEQHLGYFGSEFEAATARQKALDDASCEWSRRVCA